MQPKRAPIEGKGKPLPKLKKWKRWTLAAVAAAAMGYGAYHQRYTNDIIPPSLERSHYQRFPREMPLSGVKITNEQKKIELPPGANCAMFVRLRAEQMGITYQRGDAWRFAKRNRLVWKEGISKENLFTIIRPGHALLIKWPGSGSNHWARAGTHMFIVTKINGNEITVEHDFGGQRRKGILENELKNIKGKVIQVIEPAE